jgi:hypothetical protein
LCGAGGPRHADAKAARAGAFGAVTDWPSAPGLTPPAHAAGADLEVLHTDLVSRGINIDKPVHDANAVTEKD